jgi:hypothetical protein
LPTIEDFAELFNSSYTKFVDANGTEVSGNNKLITISGITGIRLMSLINGKTIFFPCSGNGNGTSWNGRGTGGYYWSSSLNSATQCRNLYLGSGAVNPQNSGNRYLGLACRPVASKSYKDVYPTLSGLASALGDEGVFRQVVSIGKNAGDDVANLSKNGLYKVFEDKAISNIPSGITQGIGDILLVFIWDNNTAHYLYLTLLGNKIFKGLKNYSSVTWKEI